MQEPNNVVGHFLDRLIAVHLHQKVARLIKRQQWKRLAFEGLKARGVSLAVESIVPIGTKDYPTKAKRPANSRLDLTRLKHNFGIDPPQWGQALDVELDALAEELTA